MSPLATEYALHWTAVGLYILATVGFAHAVVFDKPERLRYGLWLTWLGLVPHTAALLLRWQASGHGPYMLKYEVMSSNAWIAVVMLAVFLWRRPGWSAIALVALPLSFLMIALGLFANPAVKDLPPTLRSIWLVFHVFFNKLAVGAYLLSVAASVVLLRKLRGHHGKWLDRAPPVDALEAYVVRFVGFGFVFWATTIVAGAIWANQSWGRYWGWDVIETWSLITLLCYATFLHVRRFLHISGAAVAWWALGCFGVSALTIFILPFTMPSLHAAYFQ